MEKSSVWDRDWATSNELRSMKPKQTAPRIMSLIVDRNDEHEVITVVIRAITLFAMERPTTAVPT
jgi:hypothetical protein